MNIHSLRFDLKRPVYGAMAVIMGVAAMVPVLSQTAAAEQIIDRSIKMSNATASATGVSYEVSFTNVTAGADSLVVEFCAESPIAGDDCATPTGFTAVGGNVTAGTGTTNWTGTVVDANTVAYNKGTGDELGASAQVDFIITGVSNPTSAGTFYARLYTYEGTHSAEGNYTNANTIGAALDTGGFALSAVTQLSVDARVQETLTFCVSKSAPGSNCSGVDAPAVELGTGDPKVLDSQAIYTDTAHTQVSSNANGGVSIRLKSTTANGALMSGSNAIPAIGAAGLMSAGTASFGIKVADGTGDDATAVDAANGYDIDTPDNYKLDGAGVTSTFGDEIAASTGPVNNVNNQITFAATASNTTPAGLYSTRMILIATGTY